MYVVLTPLLALALLPDPDRARRPGSASALATLGLALLAGVHAARLGGDLLVLGGAARLLAADRADGAVRARATTRSAFTLVEMVAAFAVLARRRRCRQLEVPHGWTVWGALLVTGIFASALAFLVQTWAQQRTSATRTALVFTLEPVWAAIFGFALAGDRLGAARLGRLRRDHGRHRARRARGRAALVRLVARRARQSRVA